MASDDRLKGADLPVPYDVKRAFLRIEDELIASMMRNLGRHLKEEQDEGFDWSQWQVEQLKYLQEYRRRNRKVYGPRFQSINEKIEEAILHAHQNGQKEEELNILDAISKDKRIRPRYQNPSQASVEAAGDAFFRVNDKKLEALVEASHSDLEKAEHAVLRRVDDQYRRIIFDAQMYANTGAGTVEKAVDMATKDFLLKGIDSIQYKNGTRHTISDYADMYIRTAERRAYLMGEGKKRQEWGEQLVIVNRRGTMTAGNYGHACPQCIPWLGKILIDDVYSGGKPDGKHELLSDAMAAGFLHPRCRDGFTTYFPGISPQEDPVTKKEVKEAIEAEKEENRLQYAERQQEKYERLAEYSFDEENQILYAERADQWKEVAESKREKIDGLRRALKTPLSLKPVKGFNDLNTDLRNEFLEGLKTATPDAKKALEEYYSQADYIDGKDYKSYYSKRLDLICLGKGANAGTMAHELFHLIDAKKKISKHLLYLLENDYYQLEAASGGAVKEYLIRKYPDAFWFDPLSNMDKMKEEYLGISDILNGLSNGRILYGYGHEESYWYDRNNISAEGWAQFGRIQFENNTMVMQMLTELFPSFTKDAILALKGG